MFLFQLSYADMDPVLSDRKKYKNFYRTVPSDNDFNPARLSLLDKFNWTRVGTIFQGVSKGSARYGHVSFYTTINPTTAMSEYGLIKYSYLFKIRRKSMARTPLKP